MMINCPKCNFLQEKETYCANCGVNMDTYKPPKKPLFKKLIGNWMVQLALLFVVIFVVVLWDNLSGKDRGESRGNLPPVVNEIQREEIDTPEDNANDAQVEASSFNQPQQKRERFEQSPDERTPIENPSKEKRFYKRASMKIISLTRTSQDAFFRIGRRVDEGVYVYTRKQLKKFLKDNPGTMKSFGTSRTNFTLGQPIEIFLGEEDIVTGNSVGFFSQLNVAEGSTGDAINFEVRFWHQLTPEDGPAPLIYEATMAHQETIVILDPSVQYLEFSQEDRGLFDASETLKGLNSESFAESDVALFLEIK